MAPIGAWELVIILFIIGIPAGLLWLVVRALWRAGSRK